MCNAVKARAGDTATLAALLTANNLVSSITFTQASGPNTAIAISRSDGWATNMADTARIQVGGLAVGTYIFNVVGKDKAGGVVNGTDTISVSPGPSPCPVIPPAANRVISMVFVQVNGINRIQVTYWDGTVGILP